jgi:hypothetical protein
MERITVWGYRCKRCGHTWVPRNLGEGSEDTAPDLPLPKVCPRCKSPYWNTPRQRETENTMYAPRPSDLSYWRANAIDNVLGKRFGEMETSGAISREEHERLRGVLQDLRTNPDDAKIMELLRRYAPDDPARSKYPG